MTSPKLAAVAVLALFAAACGGSTTTPTGAAPTGAASTGAATQAAPTTATPSTGTGANPTGSAGTSPSSSADETLLIFIDRAQEQPESFFGSDEPLSIVSCSRPDPLGLKLVADRADGFEITVNVANGLGTLTFTQRPGENTPGSPKPARVSAGPDGMLLLDFEVYRATVGCG